MRECARCRTRPAGLRRPPAAATRARRAAPQRAAGSDNGAAARPEPGSSGHRARLGMVGPARLHRRRVPPPARSVSGARSGCTWRRCRALVGLVGMIRRASSRGLTPIPFTPEIGGLLAFGGAMLVGIPFSFWPGGSVKDFVDIYLKVLVIVVLMIHALDRAERIDRLIVLIVAELRVRRGPVDVRLHARDSCRQRRPPDRRSRGAYTATRTTSPSTWWCSCRLRSRPYSSRDRRPGVSWRHCAPAS